MKTPLTLMLALTLTACEKSATSEELLKAKPIIPIVYVVNTFNYYTAVQWSPESTASAGADTIIGRDSIAWSGLYDQGDEIFLKAFPTEINEKIKPYVKISIYQYNDINSMTLLASASGPAAEVAYRIPITE